MAAGDVLLFARKIDRHNFKRDKFGTFMCWLIHLTTRSRYNHAALDIGDGMMVEATSSGVRVNPIRSSDEIRAIRMRIDANAALCAGSHGLPAVVRYWGPRTLEQVLAFGAARVGWRYGFANALWCGFRTVFPGAAHIKHGRSIICSELVAEALARAGHDWDKDYALVSPGDVAEHFGVSRT